MSTDYTPPFRIEYRDQRGWHRQAWESRVQRPYNGPGRPSDQKAEEWRQAMNRSFERGGNNAHLAKSLGCVLHISMVKIVRQSTGETVARATAPMFEAA